MGVKPQQLAKLYNRFPKALFRINTGLIVKIRPKLVLDGKPAFLNGGYDIITASLEPTAEDNASAVDQEGHERDHLASKMKHAAFPNMQTDPLQRLDNKPKTTTEVAEEVGDFLVLGENDLLSDNVQPRSMRPKTWQGPNGLRLRLNTPATRYYFHRRARLNSNNRIIMSIQPGTPLPDDLVLVRPNEKADEWSLEPARTMTLLGKSPRICSF
jgi:hypothetical protein